MIAPLSLAQLTEFSIITIAPEIFLRLSGRLYKNQAKRTQTTRMSLSSSLVFQMDNLDAGHLSVVCRSHYYSFETLSFTWFCRFNNQ